jgi:iron complex outermembrane receptor protein
MPGGAINVISKKPGFDSEGYLTLGYGNYDRREARGAAQTSLIDDKLAVRAAFTMIKADGYVKNLLPGGEDRNNLDLFSGRLSFRIKPTDRLDATLTVTRTTSETNGFSYYAGNLGAAANPVLGISRVGLGYYEERVHPGSYSKTGTTGVNLRLAYDLDDVLLTSISSYDSGSWVNQGDEVASELEISDARYALTGIRQVYQELRFQSQSGGAFKWLAGASYLRDVANLAQRFSTFNDPVFNPGPTGSPDNGAYNYGNDGRHKHRNAPAFARLEFNPVEPVHLFGGVRYQNDRVSYLNYRSFSEAGVPGGFNTTVPSLADIRQTSDDDRLSFEAGLDVKPMSGLLVYASFKQGFRGAVTNSQVFDDLAQAQTVKPETLNAYKVGIKWDISRSLRANAAAFRYDYKNQQYLGLIPNSLFYGLVNAGSARIQGVEAELKVSPVRPLVLTAAGTFINPEYRKFQLNGFDRSGNQIVFAPKTALILSADLDAGELGAGGLNLHTDASYQSRTFFDDANDALVGSKGYWLLNGRINWTASDERWSAGIWTKNLLQQRYFIYGYDGRPFFGQTQLNRGEPRTFGADITFRF